jgi:hypothetical protein
MQEVSPEELKDWELERERERFFAGQLAGPVRRDRSTLPDAQLRPWLQDHRGLTGYPRVTETGHVGMARLLSMRRDGSDSEGPDISASYAWLGPEGEVLRDAVTAGYDRYTPGGLGVLLQDESAFLVTYDARTLRSTLDPVFSSLVPTGLPTALVSGWPQVKPAVLSRLLQLKTLPVSLVVLRQGGSTGSGAPPDAIDFPLPSAFPSRAGLLFPCVVPEVEAFHDLPFSAVKRAYAVINSPEFERRLAELNPPGLVVIASRDEALSRCFTHLLRGLRRARRQPFFHIGHLLGSVQHLGA